MVEKKVSSIKLLLKGGQEAKKFNSITKELLKERADKFYGLPKQANSWNALASQVVGAKHT